MYATQIVLNPGIDTALVRIRAPRGPFAVEAANAAQIDPAMAPTRAQGAKAADRSGAQAWSAEHALFALTLAAIGCLEALAVLA